MPATLKAMFACCRVRGTGPAPPGHTDAERLEFRFKIAD